MLSDWKQKGCQWCGLSSSPQRHTGWYLFVKCTCDQEPLLSRKNRMIRIEIFGFKRRFGFIPGALQDPAGMILISLFIKITSMLCMMLDLYNSDHKESNIKRVGTSLRLLNIVTTNHANAPCPHILFEFNTSFLTSETVTVAPIHSHYGDKLVHKLRGETVAGFSFTTE